MLPQSGVPFRDVLGSSPPTPTPRPTQPPPTAGFPVSSFPTPVSGPCRLLPLELPGCFPGALLRHPSRETSPTPHPRCLFPCKRRAGQWPERLTQLSHTDWPSAGWGRRKSRASRAPGRAPLCPPRAAQRGNPAPKRQSRSSLLAGAPRAHPDPRTPEPPAPLEPLAARRSASGPARSFSGPLQGGARGGPRSISRSPSPTPFPARPPDPRGAALRSDSGKEAPRGVPGVLSPAPRSGDARVAGEGAQLVRRRATRHHAPAAAAPRGGPRLAAAGECPARRAPRAPRPARQGGVSAGKPSRWPTQKRSLGLLGTWGWGRAQRREFGGLL